MYRVSPWACFRRETKTDPFLSLIGILLLLLADANKSPGKGRASAQRASVSSKWAHGTTLLCKITSKKKKEKKKTKNETPSSLQCCFQEIISGGEGEGGIQYTKFN